ncbi:MAG: phage protein Gp36 family protein [Methylophilus sp.]
MPFATRLDLLARTNAKLLANLSTPTDFDTPSEEVFRLAIEGGDLSALTALELEAINLALAAIDTALNDADALILTYGIPATVQTTLLARISSTVALYYLQGAERLTDEVSKAYDAVIATLKSHARGELSLIPPAPDAPVIAGDVILIESNRKRYWSDVATDESL